MRILLSSILMAIVAIVGVMYFFRNEHKLEKKTTFVRTFSKAGAPDQMDETELADLENNKMVSEGSQFGVQYFNKFMHD